MIFEALQARYGDSLFLTFDAPNNKKVRLLVDGGPSTVFKKFVQKRLEAERKALDLEPGDPLLIDAVMISHIDEDHIYGILDLFGALRDADDHNKPRPYDINFLLHNSFDGLLKEGEGATARTLKGETVLAGLSDVGDLPNVIDHDTMLVLQSYGQGSQLTSLAAALQISRNPPDQLPLIFDPKKPRVLRMGDAKLTIVGPHQAEVDKLRKAWEKYKKDKEKKDAKQALLATLDTSVPNLSSIVVHIECNGKTALITGDARGDKAMAGLEEAGIKKKGKVLEVDIFKLPHHGSERNVTPEVLKEIQARHYIGSGDGTYGNPDRATLEMLDDARPDGNFTIHMTYSASECDDTHEAWCKADPKKRGTYQPKKHSVVELLANWKKAGKKIEVRDGKPIVIKL